MDATTGAATTPASGTSSFLAGFRAPLSPLSNSSSHVSLNAENLHLHNRILDGVVQEEPSEQSSATHTTSSEVAGPTTTLNGDASSVLGNVGSNPGSSGQFASSDETLHGVTTSSYTSEQVVQLPDHAPNEPPYLPIENFFPTTTATDFLNLGDHLVTPASIGDLDDEDEALLSSCH